MNKLDLTALLERVRNATGPDRELDALVLCAFPALPFEMTPDAKWVGRVTFQHASGAPDSRTAPPFTASIDADVALVERVLPGWQYHMGSCGEDDMPWACITEPVDPCRDFAASAPEITIALLTALLLALTSNQEGNDEA